MIKWLRNLSFRNKLLFAFLVIGVVPLLICTVLMLNIFRVTLAGNARDAAESELDGASGALDALLEEGASVLGALTEDSLIRAELSEPGVEPPQSVCIRSQASSAARQTLLCIRPGASFYSPRGQAAQRSSVRTGGSSIQPPGPRIALLPAATAAFWPPG